MADPDGNIRAIRRSIPGGSISSWFNIIAQGDRPSGAVSEGKSEKYESQNYQMNMHAIDVVG
jgi:hypothetical protein